MGTLTADVKVVGAGLVGLLAAAELARRGVTVRIVDRLTEPTTESRAVGVQGRSLDMFETESLDIFETESACRRTDCLRRQNRFDTGFMFESSPGCDLEPLTQHAKGSEADHTREPVANRHGTVTFLLP